MATLKPEQRKRMAQFIAQRAEALPHLIKIMQDEFAQSPEGKEAKYLTGIHDGYLKSYDNFLLHFISGKPGDRGVDKLIVGLEHPSSEIKPDKSLLARLKKQADRMKKLSVPDWNEWQHYEFLRQDLLKLGTTQDIHAFITKFNELLVRATQYPHTDVSKAIMAKSAKVTPKIMMLENLEMIVAAWKLLFSRLYRPDQQALATQVLGNQDLERAVQAMARKLNISVDEFKRKVNLEFPKEREDENMTNQIAFATKVVNEGKKNLFVVIFRETGHLQSAELLLKQFGSKGKIVTNPKTAEIFAEAIGRIEGPQVKEKVERAATAELGLMITDMQGKMRKELTTEMKQFADIISGRIKEIEKKHAKKLLELKKMNQDLSRVNKELLHNAEAGTELLERMANLQKSRYEYLVRSKDITLVMKTRLLLIKYIGRTITDAELDIGFKDIYEKKPSDFAVRLITNLQSLFTAKAKGQMTQEEFDKKLSQIDDFIKKLGDQTPAIISHQEKIAQEMEDIETSLKGIQFVVDIDLKKANSMATDDVKKIGKSVDVEKYRVVGRMTPQDIDALRKVA